MITTTTSPSMVFRIYFLKNALGDGFNDQDAGFTGFSLWESPTNPNNLGRLKSSSKILPFSCLYMISC